MEKKAVSGIELTLLLTLLLISMLTLALNVQLFMASRRIYSRANESFDPQTISIQPDGDGIDKGQLTNQASHILIGRVNRVQSFWDDSRTVIYSYVEISVERWLKGVHKDSNVTLRVLGGEVGDIGFGVSSEPKFVEGEKVKVFLKRDESGEFHVVGGNQGKVSLGGTAPQGFSYAGIRWAEGDIPVKYYISTSIPASWIPAIIQSFQTWEDVTGDYMDYTYIGTIALGPPERLDGFNVISYGNIDGAGGIIAYCAYWYQNNFLLEFDIVFDSSETWSATPTCPPDAFDVQNIGTHEVGHTLVLNDLYDPSDSEETMYGYTAQGEIKKRSLYTGDISGIRSIYSYAPIHDVTIASVTLSTDLAYPGQIIYIYVTVGNEGTTSTAETFNVTVYYDDVAIGTQQVDSLAGSLSTSLTFTWNLNGVEPGKYDIYAVATAVPNEIETWDNTFIDSTLTLLVTGLVGYWNFNEGNGAISHDGSGYRNEGAVDGSLVFVADYVSIPWGTIPGFPDPNAKWVWKYPTAATSAPPESFWVIKEFFLSSPDDLSIGITVDDYYSLYVDEIFMGSDSTWETTEIYSISLSQGLHHLRIYVENGGTEFNSAGLIVSVRNSAGHIIFNTRGDGTWLFSDGTGPTWTTGKYGSALNFDGMNDSVKVPNSPSLKWFPTNEITITAWIKPRQIQTYGEILHKDLAYMIRYESNKIHGFIYDGTSWEPRVISNTTLSPETWYHVAITYDGSDLKVYINGELDGIQARTGPIYSTTSSLSIGSWSGMQNYFNGTIDDVKIYNRALSADEIKIDMTGSVGYWKFDEGYGTTAHDSSPMKNDGTIYGATWTIGKHDFAISFDGIDDHVEIPDSPSLDITDQISLEAWICPLKITDVNGKIIHKAYAYELFLWNDGRVGFAVHGELLNSTSHLNEGEWYHVTGTYDGQNMKLYINGILDNSKSATGSIPITLTPVWIGDTSIYPNSRNFNGTIDEVKIYNRALSQGEIAAGLVLDIVITDITLSKTVIGQGFTLHVSTTVKNRGGTTENFNVTVYANTTVIAAFMNINLTSGNSTTVTFTWNTTGFAKGNYTISAIAETDVADNNFTDGWVIVAMVGDISGPDGVPDGLVDIDDVTPIAIAFGSKRGDPRYHPNIDLNDDGLIDIDDVIVPAIHYGETDP